MLAPLPYIDDGENVVTPFIAWATGGDKLLVPGIVSDADIFYAPRRPQVLMAGFVADADGIRVPRLVGAQVLQPALYIAVDLFFLPAVALPGILQAHLHAVDDTILAPFISTHGSLRPALFNAFDAIYAPTLVAAQTLLPNRHTDSDTFYAPTRRTGMGPSRIVDNDVIYASTIATVPTLATFNGTLVNTTISNGGLTATHSNSVDESGACSAQNKTSGKYFFEMTVNVTHGLNDSQGILLSTGTYGDMCTHGHNCFAVDQSGGIYSNNVKPGNFSSNTVNSDILDFAIDLTARLGWVRKNNGNWNESGTANPATGTGGFTIGAGAFAPAVGFGGSGTIASDAVTANFGQSSYAYAAPAGFGNWL